MDALRLVRRWRALGALPSGNGEPVMVLPGYLTGDRLTAPLRAHLHRLGYTTVGWGLGVNHGDLGRLIPLAHAQVSALHAQTNQPVRLVGWSLGGVIARAVACRAPALIDRVVTLGTPVRGAHYTAFAGTVPEGRRHRRSPALPSTVPGIALYSPRDRIVYAEGAIDDRSPCIDHVMVDCTHLGFGVSPVVFSLLAERLR